MRSLSSDEFEPDTDVGSEGEVKELARNLQLWTLLQTVERYQAVYYRISEIALANSYFAKALLVTHASMPQNSRNKLLAVCYVPANTKRQAIKQIYARHGSTLCGHT